MVGVLIKRRRVYLKRPILIKAVVNDRRDSVLLGVVCRFLFDHGRNGHDLAHCIAAFLLPLEHLGRHSVMEDLKQLVDSRCCRHAFVKFIGIREQEAFKPARIALFRPFKE